MTTAGEQRTATKVSQKSSQINSDTHTCLLVIGSVPSHLPSNHNYTALCAGRHSVPHCRITPHQRICCYLLLSAAAAAQLLSLLL
jgi:hypothetical protein